MKTSEWCIGAGCLQPEAATLPLNGFSFPQYALLHCHCLPASCRRRYISSAQCIGAVKPVPIRSCESPSLIFPNTAVFTSDLHGTAQARSHFGSSGRDPLVLFLARPPTPWAYGRGAFLAATSRFSNQASGFQRFIAQTTDRFLPNRTLGDQGQRSRFGAQPPLCALGEG